MCVSVTGDFSDMVLKDLFIFFLGTHRWPPLSQRSAFFMWRSPLTTSDTCWTLPTRGHLCLSDVQTVLSASRFLSIVQPMFAPFVVSVATRSPQVQCPIVLVASILSEGAQEVSDDTLRNRTRVSGGPPAPTLCSRAVHYRERLNIEHEEVRTSNLFPPYLSQGHTFVAEGGLLQQHNGCPC